MDREEILNVLEAEYNATDLLDLTEVEKWQFYEILKQSLQKKLLPPQEYTREIVKISEVLEL